MVLLCHILSVLLKYFSISLIIQAIFYDVNTHPPKSAPTAAYCTASETVKVAADASVPSVSVAAAIIAEIGTDMSSFPDSQHICSWAGLSPGNNESAGKRKSVHINKGNPYLKSMLCEVAWIMASHRKLYLSGWYWKVKQRKGAKRATIALARKILSIIYTMLKTGTPYNEECFEQRRLRCERKRANRLVNELQKLGYVVVAPD